MKKTPLLTTLIASSIIAVSPEISNARIDMFGLVYEKSLAEVKAEREKQDRQTRYIGYGLLACAAVGLYAAYRSDKKNGRLSNW